MKDIRPWTYAALFGSLWGAAEVSLGAVLSAARVPLSGLLMASIGVLCLVTARRLFPAAGMSLVMGVVVAFLKVFSAGGFVIGPVIGILSESLLVELAMSLSRSTAPGAVLGGALALATAPLQQVIWIAAVAGPEGAAAFDRALRKAAAVFGWHGPSSAGLVLALAGAAGLLGGVVGALSWRVAGRVRRRLRGSR
jgi:hypothetical protein